MENEGRDKAKKKKKRQVMELMEGGGITGRESKDFYFKL